MQYDYPLFLYENKCFACGKELKDNPNWCLFCFNEYKLVFLDVVNNVQIQLNNMFVQNALKNLNQQKYL